MDKLVIQEQIKTYLDFCNTRKNLSQKTIKSYDIDLNQYSSYVLSSNLTWYEKKSLENYISSLHSTYKAKSVKRKTASLKAFFHFLELEELIDGNPFHKIQLNYKEPFILPKTIPLNVIEKLMNHAYSVNNKAKSEYAKQSAVRNVLILELLFVTGMRISELCSLKIENIILDDFVIKIYGKGAKERLIQICNENVQILLESYISSYCDKDNNDSLIFKNRLHNRLSEQSVRNMITKYAEEAGISLHITPHMFRHSFATLLLEEDVDIRYIQQMLGHSSITTTQIYTHISMSKQKDILKSKHPRNKIDLGIGDNSKD